MRSDFLFLIGSDMMKVEKIAGQKASGRVEAEGLRVRKVKDSLTRMKALKSVGLRDRRDESADLAPLRYRTCEGRKSSIGRQNFMAATRSAR